MSEGAEKMGASATVAVSAAAVGTITPPARVTAASTPATAEGEGAQTLAGIRGAKATPLRPATVFYLLFNSSTEGMAMYLHLRKQGCRVRVAPAPRGHTACCGTSVLVEPADMPDVRAVLDADPSLPYDRIIELENPINPHRDVFC